VVVAYRVVVLTDIGGHEVAGGAVPVGNVGKVPLNEAPVLRAMEAPPVEVDGRRVKPWVPTERVWTRLKVPERGLFELLKDPEIEPVPVGSESV
jgi:hypothetical protein